MKKYPAILLVGPPGSGKGTQGKMLGNVPGLFHCSCGDVFRNIEPATELGGLFISYSSQGKLVPDDVTIRLWLDYVQRCQNARLFCPDRDVLLLDGIPRNLAQAQLLESFIEVKLALKLVCASRKVLLERIKRRAVKENRLDDACDEVILNRLMVYQEQSEPMLQYFQDEKTRAIEASKPPLTVNAQIMNILRHELALRAPVLTTPGLMAEN